MSAPAAEKAMQAYDTLQHLPASWEIAPLPHLSFPNFRGRM